MSGVRGGIGVVIVHVCVSVLLGLSLFHFCLSDSAVSSSVNVHDW